MRATTCMVACAPSQASVLFWRRRLYRKLSLSASLGWAEETQKRHAQNSDGDTYNYHRNLGLSCVFGRFARLSWHLADRTGGKIGAATAMIFF